MNDIEGGEGTEMHTDHIAEALDETYDPDDDDAPAFLAPRLAAYAAAAPELLEGGETAYEEQPNGGQWHDDTLDEEEERGGERAVVVVADETVEEGARSSPFADGEEEEEGETFDYYDVADGGGADNEEEESDEETEDRRAAHVANADGEAREDLTNVFPVSRVKDLLKYEGSSTIISRDACLAASEAVALVLRDMAKCAAAEAQRRNRRTVTYDDVARVVQLFDRFAFLSEVIPAPSATLADSATGSSGGGVGSSGVVVVGAKSSRSLKAEKAQRSRRMEEQQQRQFDKNGADLGTSPYLKEQKTNRVNGKNRAAAAGKGRLPAASSSSAAIPSSSGHPMLPGADSKRQTTLRF